MRQRYTPQKKHVAQGTLVLLVFGLGVYGSHKIAHPPVSVQPAQAQVAVRAAVVKSTSPQRPMLPDPSKVAPLALPHANVVAAPKIPSHAALREEITANPHSTPKSFLRFAAHWALALQGARDNASLAQHLLTQARACAAEDTGAALMVRAFCIDNARLLAELHPTLHTQYAALRAGADGSVTRLLP